MTFDVHVKGMKIKDVFDLDIATIHLLYKKKKFLEIYLNWFMDKELYVPYATLIEMMIGSTFRYIKIIVMNALRIN